MKTLTELRRWNVAHQRARRDQVRPGAARHLGRDGRRAPTARATRPTARRTCGSSATEGIDAVMKAHQLDALLFPGAQRRGDRRQARLSDGHRAVRHRCRTRRRRAFPAGFDAEAGAVRRELHRHGVQRAAAHRAGVRVRAGDQAPDGALQLKASPRRCKEVKIFSIIRFPVGEFQPGGQGGEEERSDAVHWS